MHLFTGTVAGTFPVAMKGLNLQKQSSQKNLVNAELFLFSVTKWMYSVLNIVYT